MLGFANSSDPQFPRQKLFDFERISLAPGESKSVMLTVTAEALSVVDEDGRRWLRPATITLHAGDVIVPAEHTFEVVGSEHLLDDSSRAY